MNFIKKGNVRIRKSKKKHHIPPKLKTSKESRFVGTCPVFGKETNAKSKIEEENKKLKGALRVIEGWSQFWRQKNRSIGALKADLQTIGNIARSTLSPNQKE